MNTRKGSMKIQPLFAGFIVKVMQHCKPYWSQGGIIVGAPSHLEYPTDDSFKKIFDQLLKECLAEHAGQPGLETLDHAALREEAYSHVKPWIDAKSVIRVGHLKEHSDPRTKAI